MSKTKTENLEDTLDTFDEYVNNEPNWKFPEKKETNILPWLHYSHELVPPFTYFGGKRHVASEVWKQFGPYIKNYREPFAGGLSVLLARPVKNYEKFLTCNEYINDTNIFLYNFWNTVRLGEIEELIEFADFPSHEIAILNRRRLLMKELPALEKAVGTDPKKYNAELAGFWLYINRNWIGAGADDPNSAPDLKKPKVGHTEWKGGSIENHIKSLYLRLKKTQAFVGDWKRAVSSETMTTKKGITGVFLDPPYRGTENYYAELSNTIPERLSIADDVDHWALERGDEKKFRIAVCGYENNFSNLEQYKEKDWYIHKWKPSIGHRSNSKKGIKKVKEIIAFSRYCLNIPKKNTN
jgi:site-specific DNA-adenine methylase